MRRASRVYLRRAFATRSAGRKVRKPLVLHVPNFARENLGKARIFVSRYAHVHRGDAACARETARAQLCTSGGTGFLTAAILRG